MVCFSGQPIAMGMRAKVMRRVVISFKQAPRAAIRKAAEHAVGERPGIKHAPPRPCFAVVTG